MDASRFDALAVQKMASGHVCLNLSERVGWEAFPSFAECVLEMIDGRVTQKIETVDMRLWQVNVRGCALELVFDDYPLMVSLESADDAGDLLVANLYRDFSGTSV